MGRKCAPRKRKHEGEEGLKEAIRMRTKWENMKEVGKGEKTHIADDGASVKSKAVKLHDMMRRDGDSFCTPWVLDLGHSIHTVKLVIPLEVG